ncbi:hypothetical protein [Xanthomonas theicola]|nr:hypothetical protein [Xanthomonas theicola]
MFWLPGWTASGDAAASALPVSSASFALAEAASGVSAPIANSNAAVNRG